MTLIANTLPLREVVADLANRRPVFHSEADLQFAFAQTLNRLDPDLQVRLEVPHRDPDGKTRYVDLVCHSPAHHTLIEFKYFTRASTWVAPNGEQFSLRSHAATDLARLNFIHDVERLEALTRDKPETNGIALILTNAPALWAEPQPRPSRDAAFRIHQGRTLTGTLNWGTADQPYIPNQHTLHGTYTADWNDYANAHAPDDSPRLRWLAFEVSADA